MLTSLKALWYRLPESWRYEIRSVIITFIAAFATVITVFFNSGSEISFSREALIALSLTALRAGIKAALTLVFAKLSSLKK